MSMLSVVLIMASVISVLSFQYRTLTGDISHRSVTKNCKFYTCWEFPARVILALHSAVNM